jgi:hypothetical protein
MPYPAIPHLELPIRRGAHGGLVAVEQDTLEDVASCVRLVLHTPLGHIDANPDLGRPELAFMPTSADELRALIERAEPRVDLLVEDNRLTDLVREVRVEVA